jgi:hypothetical protein
MYQDGLLLFELQNNRGHDIFIMPSDPYTEESPWGCMTICSIENMAIASEGGAFVDVSKYPLVRKDSSFTVRVTCSGLDKDYIDQVIPLSYNGGEAVDMSATEYFHVSARIS